MTLKMRQYVLVQLPERLEVKRRTNPEYEVGDTDVDIASNLVSNLVRGTEQSTPALDV
jgi:hypothetical protein